MSVTLISGDTSGSRTKLEQASYVGHSVWHNSNSGADLDLANVPVYTSLKTASFLSGQDFVTFKKNFVYKGMR